MSGSFNVVIILIVCKTMSDIQQIREFSIHVSLNEQPRKGCTDLDTFLQSTIFHCKVKTGSYPLNVLPKGPNLAVYIQDALVSGFATELHKLSPWLLAYKQMGHIQYVGKVRFVFLLLILKI